MTARRPENSPVSTHSRPKAAACVPNGGNHEQHVSTHSRPKAAAPSDDGADKADKFQHTAARRRLPPVTGGEPVTHKGFNTQPPEGGCWRAFVLHEWQAQVSTHSRPKAAAHSWRLMMMCSWVSTHSRPKAAALERFCDDRRVRVSTHSRPKAAASAIQFARSTH